MQKKLRLKISYFAFFVFIVIILAILLKFVFDFYFINKSVKIEKGENNQKSNSKIIVNPRVQINQDGLNYITAETGYLDYDNDKYNFEKVEMTSNFGYITSGKLEIRNNKKFFEFTENPNFTIYLKNVEDKQNNSLKKI